MNRPPAPAPAPAPAPGRPAAPHPALAWALVLLVATAVPAVVAPAPAGGAAPIEVIDLGRDGFEALGDRLARAASRPEAEPAVRLALRYGERRGSRTIVEALLAVPPALVAQSEYGFYNLAVRGVVEHPDGRLLERFDLRFELNAPEAAEDGVGALLPLLFERRLRPGAYRLALRLEDLSADALFYVRTPIRVPEPPGAAPAVRVTSSGAPGAPGAPDAAVSLELVPPDVPIVTGYQRFHARIWPGGGVPGVDRVVFALDGEPVFSRRRPPYDVELDLGSTARVQTVTATALDADGAVVARDELVLNTGIESCAVHLVEPRPGERYDREVAVRTRLELPPSRRVERVEIFVDGASVASLEEPPYEVLVRLPEERAVATVAAVAHLDLGVTLEDSVVVNAPGETDEVEVRAVELYTAVTNRWGDGVRGLDRSDFRVYEDGVPQSLTAFRRADELPFLAALVLDVSQSMALDLPEVKEALVGFIDRTMRPQDRAMLVTFDDRPRVAVGFTGDTRALANGLVGLEAAGETALLDSLVFTLRQLGGLPGQRAVVVFSDGVDLRSRVDEEAVVELARRSGVTIYTIGYRLDTFQGEGHALLERLAEETGGLAYNLSRLSKIDRAYREIEQALRSRYLLVYESSGEATESARGPGGFRVVNVEVERDGFEAKTVRGYYP